MKTIVITGATRGIGFGLAAEFLKRGHSVAICGRTQEAVDGAVEKLAEISGPERVFGIPCDVRELDQVERLWDTSAARFNRIDIWINNAGLAHPTNPAWELAPKVVQTVLDVNIIGTYNGCRVAIPRLIEQGGGAIYNMEGFGSRTGPRSGLSIYGTSKAATAFLSRSLVVELKDTPVILGTLQPGMVATEMVTGQFEGREDEWKRTKKILNIFVETVDGVVPKIAERILANEKHGKEISVSSSAKVMLRFMMAPFTKRKVFD